ncbi:deoxyhypusine synthase [Pseudoloma neurophilia]|uniref:deoxyhypusine synthase n=1 Tax=Pseudoloma neurophilia TaxID=146866 RepID=A0A0R0M580_9MICR|nr:deoxyhypusine synthase [Pseudoloma neurophilia]
MSFNIDDLLENYKNGSHESQNLYDACKEFQRFENCKVFFGCSSELLSDKTNEMIFYLIVNKMVNVMVVNVDFIIYQMLYPQNLHKEQDENLKISFLRTRIEYIQKNLGDRKHFCISDIIHEIGMILKDNCKFLHIAAQNNISIYVPDFCDSHFGMLFKGIIIDQLNDCKKLNRECFFIKNTAAVILGTSNIKHAILNANLFKNGLNSCIIVNSCNEMDCSDSGANIDEAVSWGKIIPDSSSIKIRSDPSLVFPILWHAWIKTFEKNLEK